MPGKSKYQRKPKAKKAAKRARKATHNLETYRQVIKQTATITPAQGVTVSNYVNFFVSPVLFGGNYNTLSLSGSTEYALYNKMYDQMRVHSVTLKIIPRANMTEQSNLITLNDTAYLTAGKNIFYTVEDRDGIAPASIQTLKKYSSVKEHRNDKKMVRTYRVKYEGQNGWFDCQDTGAMDQIQQNLGLLGGLTVYGESFIERSGQVLNSVWADVEVTYNMTYRGKALVSIAVDADTGKVTLADTPSVTLEALQVFTGNDVVNHFGSVDTSGNQIGTFTVKP